MKKLGIIGAMTVEVETLKGALSDMKVVDRAGMTFYEGSLAGLPSVVVVCGVGNGGKYFAVLIGSHDMNKLVFRELFDGGKSLCNGGAMVSVCAKENILGLHAICLTDGGGFLSDAKVNGR